MASLLGIEPSNTTNVFDSSPSGGTSIDASTDVTCKSVTADTITANMQITVADVDVKDNSITVSSGNTGDGLAGSIAFEHKNGSVYHSGLIKKPNSDDIIVFKPTTTAINGGTNVNTLLRGNLVVGTLKSTNVSSESGSITIIDTANSVSTTSGALIINGGLGVNKTIMSNSIATNSAAVGTGQDAIATNNAALVVYGGIGTGKTIICGGTTDTSNTAVGALIVSGGVGIAKGIAVGGISLFLNSTDSASTYSGSIIVSGGLSVQKSLYVGNKLRVTLNSNSTDTLTGAFTVAGGVGIGNNLNVGGTLISNLTSDSTDTLTGSLLVYGGAGISKGVNIGGNLNVIATTISNATNTGAIICSGGVGIAKQLTAGGIIKTSATTIASDTLTGALVVTGGASVGGTLQVGGNVQMQGDGSFYLGNTGGTYIDRFGNQYAQSGAGLGSFFSYFTNATGGVGGNPVPVFRWYNNIARSPSIEYFGTVDSTSATSGALVCGGGFGVGKKMYVGTGVYLPTSGGTASSLNYYEEYTHTTNWSGPWSSNQAGNVLVTRIGRIVTITVPFLSALANGSAASVSSVTNLPARFYPNNASAHARVHVRENASWMDGLAVVDFSTGNISISVATTGAYSTTFAAVGTCAIYGFSMTYNI